MTLRIPFCLMGLTALITASVAITGCGGSADDTRAEPARVVTLMVHSPDDDLVGAAAQEHGAPGESETVLYRVRSSDPATSRAAVARLLDSGFISVEVE